MNTDIEINRIPQHMRLPPARRMAEARFTPRMGEELEFYFQRSDAALGERSSFGAMVDQSLSGANRGGLVGDHSAMIARLAAAAKAKRIADVLAEVGPRTRKILEARYSVGGSGARVATDLVPGLTHPGVAYALDGPAKLRALSKRLRSPDAGDHNQRAVAKKVRDGAREELKGPQGVNARCEEAVRRAEASYAAFRAYLTPRMPKRARLEEQDAMRELDEAMGPPLELPRVRYEHEPVFRKAVEA